MGTTIRFKVKASELNEAIDIVSIVPPRPFDRNNTSGFLFVVRKVDGKDMGFIYSNDKLHTTRADFPLYEVDGEGAFIYPGTNIKAFTYFKDMINFEIKNEEVSAEEGGGSNFSITYDGGKGAGNAPRPLFNPKWMQACDKELEAAEAASSGSIFSAGLLREALNLAKSFHGGSNQKGDDDHFNVVQLFNKDHEVDDPENAGKKLRPFENGDGYLFASDRQRTLHFQCDSFMGKHLTVHSTHIPLLQAFLAKVDGNVKVVSGANKTFAKDLTPGKEGRVFGWAHTDKVHTRFVYSSGVKGVDSAILFNKIDKHEILNALKYIKEELETGHDKIRVNFKASGPSGPTIQFEIADGKGFGLHSMFVEAVPDESSTNVKDFSISANVESLMSLFAETKSNRIALRVSVTEPNPAKGRMKQNGFFRTFDDFILDSKGKVVSDGKTPEGAATCKVTRYTPSYTE